MAPSAALMKHVAARERRLAPGEVVPATGSASGEQKGVDGHVSPAFGSVQAPDDVDHIGPSAGIVRHALHGDVRQPGSARQGEAGAQLGIHELAHLAELQQRLHQCHGAHRSARCRREEDGPMAGEQLQHQGAEGVDVGVFCDEPRVGVFRGQVAESRECLVGSVHDLLGHDVGQAVVCEERVALLVQEDVACPEVLVDHRQRLREAFVQMRQACRGRSRC